MEEGFVLTRNWDRIPIFYNGIYKKKYQKIKSRLDSLEKIGGSKEAMQYVNFYPQGKMMDLEKKIHPELIKRFMEGVGMGYIKEISNGNERRYSLTNFGRSSYLNTWSGRETPGDKIMGFIFGKFLKLN